MAFHAIEYQLCFKDRYPGNHVVGVDVHIEAVFFPVILLVVAWRPTVEW
jgi:hypothetical protein